MTKFEDNISPYVSFVEGSAPSSPAATNFKLYYDSADHLLKWKNSAGTVTTLSTSGALTVSENHLGSDTTLTQNTYGDGPSLSLAAGTYLLDGHVEVTTVAAGWITVKLMNGSTPIDAAEGFQTTATAGLSFYVAGYVVLGSTTTVKIQAAQTGAGGGTILKTPATNATGLTGLTSYLRAVKIA